MSTGPGPHPRTQDDAVWVEAMTEAYARCLEGPVFAPFAAEPARRVAEHRPSRVLEVAAGSQAPPTRRPPCGPSPRR